MKKLAADKYSEVGGGGALYGEIHSQHHHIIYSTVGFVSKLKTEKLLELITMAFRLTLMHTD